MGELPARIGSYRIVGRLNERGEGRIFEGVHRAWGWGRRAAIKILPAAAAQDPLVAARFANEARIMSLVRHSGIVELFDLAKEPSGLVFLVMEHLAGQTLGRRVRVEGALPVERAVALGQKLAEALAAIHANGILHLNVEPENVILIAAPAGGERTKIIDFGNARAVREPEKLLKELAAACAPDNLEYAAPELLRPSETPTEKADVYALGAVLCFMLTGRPPFPNLSKTEATAGEIYAHPPKLGDWKPFLPGALVELVQRMLSAQETVRPTMREVAAELSQLGSDRRAAAAPKLASAEATKEVAISVASPPTAPPAPTPSPVAPALEQRTSPRVEEDWTLEPPAHSYFKNRLFIEDVQRLLMLLLFILCAAIAGRYFIFKLVQLLGSAKEI